MSFRIVDKLAPDGKNGSLHSKRSELHSSHPVVILVSAPLCPESIQVTLILLFMFRIVHVFPKHLMPVNGQNAYQSSKARVLA